MRKPDRRAISPRQQSPTKTIPSSSKCTIAGTTIPPAGRNRDNLRAIVQSGCDQRAAMAAYWLGFFAPSIDPNKEVADLQALEAIVHKNTPDAK